MSRRRKWAGQHAPEPRPPHAYLPPIFELPATGYGMTHTRIYLYVVEILDVGSKVGITNEPAARLMQHVTNAWSYRRRLGRAWIGKHVFRASNAEAELVRRFGSGPSKSEYLDTPFDEVVPVAIELLGLPGIYPSKVERTWLRGAARIVDERPCMACSATRLARALRRMSWIHECLACGAESEIPEPEVGCRRGENPPTSTETPQNKANRPPQK